MIVEMKTTKSIKVTHVRIQVPDRHEDMSPNFPFLERKVWSPTIELSTGRIVDWPHGLKFKLYLKVCDSGRYHLMDDGVIIKTIFDYVPDFIPNKWGDYLDFDIDENGVILNWDTPDSIIEMIEEYLNEEE